MSYPHRPQHSHPTLGDYNLYAWCACCQVVYPTKKMEERGWHCPTADCNGQFDDIWRWEEVRIAYPEFPNHPILGRVYKLYAFESELTDESATAETLINDSGQARSWIRTEGEHGVCRQLKGVEPY